MRKFEVFFTIIPLLVAYVACKDSVSNKESTTEISSRPLQHTINRGGVEKSDAYFLECFLENVNIDSIISGKYIIDSEVKFGIYLNCLLDKGHYTKVNDLIDSVQPVRYVKLAGDLSIPVYEEHINPYVRLGLLKSFSLQKGYPNSELAYMYANCLSSFTKGSVEYALYRLEYLYYHILKEFESEGDVSFTNELAELSSYEQRFPRYNKLLLNVNLIRYLQKRTSGEEFLTHWKKENLFLEQLIKLLLKQQIDSKTTPISDLERLIANYRARFSFCNTEILRFYLVSDRLGDKNFSPLCNKCLESQNSLDSVKARIYESIFLLHQNDFARLETNINNYFIKTKNATFFLESDFRMREFNQYEELSLRRLLKMGEIPRYLAALSKMRYSLIDDNENIESIKGKTKEFFLLDISKNGDEFELFFRQKVLPVWILSRESKNRSRL